MRCWNFKLFSADEGESVTIRSAYKKQNLNQVYNWKIYSHKSFEKSVITSLHQNNILCWTCRSARARLQNIYTKDCSEEELWKQYRWSCSIWTLVRLVEFSNHPGTDSQLFHTWNVTVKKVCEVYCTRLVSSSSWWSMKNSFILWHWLWFHFHSCTTGRNRQ